MSDAISPGSQRAQTDAVFDRLLAHLVDTSPVAATQLGDHSRDADLDDWGPGAAAQRLRQIGALRADLDRVSGDGADPELAGDILLLGDALDGITFELASQRAHERDPLFFLGIATGAVYELLRREDLPQQPRATAAAARAAQVPRLLAQAQALLTEVSQPRRDLALLRLPGAIQLFGDVLTGFAPEASDEAALAVEACRSFGTWLEALDGPFPEWRLGQQPWDDALRLALGVQMPREELWERAQANLAQCQEDMERLSSALLGERARGLSGRELVREGVAVASRDQSDRTAVVRDAAGVLDDIKAFIRDHGEFALPEPDTLRVEEVPPFMQGAAIAYFVPAPPLETSAAHTYYLSPVPESWTDDQAASFLREYNQHALRSVGIHEAYPGHYAQLAFAQRHPRLLRRVLWNSAFVEGWAVYVERRLIEAGFGDQYGTDAGNRMRLIGAKMEMRSAANAILDQGLHVRGWTDAQAVELMVDHAYQERAEADAKLMRAKTSSGQLSTYFVGGEEMDDLRRDAQKLRGASFSAAQFHADVMAQGSPPFAVHRRALLGDAA